MTVSWKSVEEDGKANQTHAMQVSKEQPHPGVTRNGHAGVSETDQMIAMNTGGMPHGKQKTPTGAPKAPGKKEETNQVRCKAIQVEPPQPPKGPYGTNARGDAPSQNRNAHQRRKSSGKTRCKRGDNATGANNETDANKRRRARSGHSQRASAKPTTEAYKATTKKERGKE